MARLWRDKGKREEARELPCPAAARNKDFVLPAMRVAVTLAGGTINQLGSRGTAGAFGAPSIDVVVWLRGLGLEEVRGGLPRERD